MKEKIKKILMFILNPRLLLCAAVAWMITNGWSYILFVLGTWLDIGWMIAVSGAYLTYLWLPISPEKLLTFTIAIALLRWWFPKDEKTLKILRESYNKAKEKWQEFKNRRKEKKQRD